MHLKKHVGCLLALGLATTSAFAAEWFTATVQADLSAAGWTGATDSWTWSGTYGKLNSPDAELKFVAATPKTLPGDESTISTVVKFTAMDKADFLENGELPKIPTDAKGGLTIIEDSDVNPATTKFYGIVGGAWVELEGDTTAALAGQVNVEVKIWENNGKHISYKVGGQPLTLNGKSDLTASFIESTISSVSYKGVCEIASLQGDAQDELWTMTLQTIAAVRSAVITLADNQTKDVTFTDNAATVQVSAKNLPTSIVFAPALNCYFFNGSAKGEDTFTKSVTDVASGDATISTATDFAGITVCEAVAEDSEANKYASVAAALNADTQVKIVADPTEAAIEISKTGVRFDATEGVIINSNITIDEGKDLTIVGGKYKGLFTNKGKLTLAGPAFFLKLPTTEAVDAQDLCADEFFARTLTGGDYLYQVVKGEVIQLTGDAPAIAVDPAEIPQGKTAATYLAEPVAEDSTMKRWESYALGLGTAPDPTFVPEITAVAATEDKDADKIDLTANFKPLTQTGIGYKIMISKDGAEAAAADAINLTDVTGVHKFTVSVSLVDKDKAEKSSGLAQSVIGANKIAVEKDARTLVTVPWTANKAGDAVTIEELFKNANVMDGDKIEVYDTEKDAYFTWTRDSGSWVPGADIAVVGGGNIVIPAAGAYMVARGQAVWFTATAAGSIYQVGTADAAAGKTTLAAGNHWGHIANPVSGTAKTLSQLMASAPAKATVELVDGNGKTRLYSFDSTNGWGYEDYVATTKTVRGKKTTVATKTHVQNNPTIAPGKAFWLMNEDATDSTIIQW